MNEQPTKLGWYDGGLACDVLLSPWDCIVRWNLSVWSTKVYDAKYELESFEQTMNQLADIPLAPCL